MFKTIPKENDMNVHVKLWIDGVEESATKQIMNLSKLPFAFHHIAIMPDCHTGYGMPIGGVLATENVVIPNAVGVDIGCFSEDTQVSLLNGTEKTLKELTKEKKPFYVYSVNDRQEITGCSAISKKTRKNAKLVEVSLDNEQKIKCTIDHKFMLRDGSYCEAGNLKTGDSLFPLYRKYGKDNYESIYNSKTKTYQKTIIHHKDFNQDLYNHKIVKITPLAKKEDVYCLTVEKFHNFALSAGVFVHNCGMCAVKSDMKDLGVDKIKTIMGKIRKEIPVGFKHHEEIHRDWMPQPINANGQRELPIIDVEFYSACKQVGTLGGGNHFIEIQKDKAGFVWIMVHSGSRNLGKKVADHYNKLAKKLNEKWFSSIPKEYDLAFFPYDSDECRDYLREMAYCLDFAFANRKAMINVIIKIMREQIPLIRFEEPINIHHNYARMENHFGRNVIIHRKGATSAREGQLGIIPGSQGSKSYIVKGKGNPDSFNSCSHGAGRRMGRKQAIRTLNLQEEIKKLNDQGVIHSIRTEQELDEATGAYKDIDMVMNNQKDLVEIIAELAPLAVIKG